MRISASTDQPAKARLAIVLTGLSAACLAVAFSAYLVDPRLLGGVSVWAKPMKFALSFVVLFGTVSWLESRLSREWRDGLLLRVTLALMGTAMVTEMGYLMFQAAQAEPSHFNVSTPFHRFMYSVVMFAGALALVAGIGIYGAAAHLDRAADLTPGLRLGVVTGFGMSCVLTVVVAGYMATQTGPLVGTPVTGAILPVVGWSTEVGDLRPAHFLSLHAMQVLPFLGWCADRLTHKTSPRAVTLSATAYAGVTLLAFFQALSGNPVVWS